jgi:hypothetical protein
MFHSFSNILKIHLQEANLRNIYIASRIIEFCNSLKTSSKLELQIQFHDFFTTIKSNSLNKLVFVDKNKQVLNKPEWIKSICNIIKDKISTEYLDFIENELFKL